MTSNTMSYEEVVAYFFDKAIEAEKIVERDGLAFMCMTPDGLLEVLTVEQVEARVEASRE